MTPGGDLKEFSQKCARLYAAVSKVLAHRKFHPHARFGVDETTLVERLAKKLLEVIDPDPGAALEALGALRRDFLRRGAERAQRRVEDRLQQFPDLGARRQNFGVDRIKF